jgi:hypothetical protein
MLPGMDASFVIEKFGGPVAVAARFGVSRTAPYNWRRDGIPSRLWMDFVAAAEADGKEIPVAAIRWRPACDAPAPAEAA